MKRIFATLLSLLVVSITLNGLMAQEAESPREVRVMMKKNVNGVETNIDTTITLQTGQTVQGVIEEMGLDVNMGHHNGDGPHIMKMRIDGGEGENVFIHSAEDSDSEVDVNVERNEDGTMKVTVTRDGEVQTIDVKGENSWTTDDGTIIKVKSTEGASFIGEEGEQIKIIRLGDDDLEHNVEVEVVGEGDERMVIINRDGVIQEIDLGAEGVWTDDESGTNVNVFRFNTEDGEEVEHVEIDKRIIMIQDEDLSEEDRAKLEEALKLGDHEDMLENIKIIVGDDAKVINSSEIHMVRIEIKMEEPGEEEMNMLRNSGASDLNNSLQLDELSFYPNPNNGQFSLNFQAAEEGSLSVIVRDLQGRTVYQEDASEFNGVYQNDINISGESAGVYFLTINVNGRSTTKKLVME